MYTVADIVYSNYGLHNENSQNVKHVEETSTGKTVGLQNNCVKNKAQSMSEINKENNI